MQILIGKSRNHLKMWTQRFSKVILSIVVMLCWIISLLIFVSVEWTRNWEILNCYLDYKLRLFFVDYAKLCKTNTRMLDSGTSRKTYSLANKKDSIQVTNKCKGSCEIMSSCWWIDAVTDCTSLNWLHCDNLVTVSKVKNHCHCNSPMPEYYNWPVNF